MQAANQTLHGVILRIFAPGFLVPEDAPLSACTGVTGQKPNSDIAALQRDYFDLAEQNPRVIGLMNFGFWTAPAWTSGHGVSSLPLTVQTAADTHRSRIGCCVLGVCSPPCTCSTAPVRYDPAGEAR